MDERRSFAHQYRKDRVWRAPPTSPDAKSARGSAHGRYPVARPCRPAASRRESKHVNTSQPARRCRRGAHPQRRRPCPGGLAAHAALRRSGDPGPGPRFERYRIGLAGVERLATDLNRAKGPAWFGDTRMLLFSDVQNSRIMRWDEERGQTAVFRKPANHSDGLTRDRQGRLVVCEHATRRVARTEHDGSGTVPMDGFEGKPLNSPNDVVCKSDGSIWFTDPAFGPNPFEGMVRPELPGNVYRIAPRRGRRRASSKTSATSTSSASPPTRRCSTWSRRGPRRTA